MMLSIQCFQPKSIARLLAETVHYNKNVALKNTTNAAALQIKSQKYYKSGLSAYWQPPFYFHTLPLVPLRGSKK